MYSDQTLSEGTPTCAHSSISIAITAVVFQGAPFSSDELNDPHRKLANHTEYHYQSLLIKLDCFTVRANVVASFLLLSIFFLMQMVLSTAAERLVMFSNNWFHNECTT